MPHDPYAAARLVEALQTAFHEELGRQGLSAVDILNGVTLFFGSVVCDLIHAAGISPEEREAFLHDVVQNVVQAVEVSERDRREA